MKQWKTIDSAPEQRVVLTKLEGGHEANEQPLIRKGRLWWTTDMRMYVYYTPTHWTEV